jgi:hypothetical protein
VTTGEEPQGLADEQEVFYLEVLVAHGSVFGASVCASCGVARCQAWVDAHDRLVAAKVPIEPR